MCRDPFKILEKAGKVHGWYTIYGKKSILDETPVALSLTREVKKETADTSFQSPKTKDDNHEPSEFDISSLSTYQVEILTTLMIVIVVLLIIVALLLYIKPTCQKEKEAHLKALESVENGTTDCLIPLKNLDIVRNKAVCIRLADTTNLV